MCHKTDIMTTIIIPKYPFFCNGISTKNAVQIMKLSLRFAAVANQAVAVDKLLRELERVLARLELDGDGGNFAGDEENPPLECRLFAERRHCRKVKDTQRHAQRTAFLADFHDTARCGARTKQRNGNQIHDALRGIAVPVDDFIEQIVRVLLRADCRHAAIQIHPLLAGGDVGFRDVCRYVEVRRAFRLLERFLAALFENRVFE